MTDNPTHPMQPIDLRYWLTFLTLERRPRFWGDATPSQARSIAMRLDVIFKDSPTQRRDRLDVIEYIFGRRFASSKGLTRAEASAILDWLTKTPPAALAVECERCLTAYKAESGQLVIPELEGQ